MALFRTILHKQWLAGLFLFLKGWWLWTVGYKAPLVGVCQGCGKIKRLKPAGTVVLLTKPL